MVKRQQTSNLEEDLVRFRALTMWAQIRVLTRLKKEREALKLRKEWTRRLDEFNLLTKTEKAEVIKDYLRRHKKFRARRIKKGKWIEYRTKARQS